MSLGFTLFEESKVSDNYEIYNQDMATKIELYDMSLRLIRHGLTTIQSWIHV